MDGLHLLASEATTNGRETGGNNDQGCGENGETERQDGFYDGSGSGHRACRGARPLRDEGATVHASDISRDLMDALKIENSSIRTSIVDARDTENVQAAAREIGAVDVLFNCAGYVHQGDVLACDEEDWDRSFDTNVKSMWRTLRAFLPAMLENGGGSVINMASGASSIKGVPNRFVYSTTKAAVIGLTKALAADYITRGIRSNAICPGTIVSPSLEERIRALPGTYEENHAAFVARQPLGRMGTPEEVAALAVYLASDESAFTTGTAIEIDGGWTL